MNRSFRDFHSFHILDNSPWPLFSAFCAFNLTVESAIFFHGYPLYTGGLIIIVALAGGMIYWWVDVIRETIFEGFHTCTVQNGLRFGMLLFIASEVMFFFAFFLTFFYSSLNPSNNVGGIWPPLFLNVLNPWKIPLLNTIILLSSGAAITWTHNSLLNSNKKNSLNSLIITLFLAIIFTYLQKYEYQSASLTLADGIYGSIFYLITGFHGFHVLIGTTFLGNCLTRICFDQTTSNHHVGFEAAAWYWHFVDIVWLFLFVTIYWWGGLI